MTRSSTDGENFRIDPRPVTASVDEMLAGARRLGAYRPPDARSSAGFERVERDGQRLMVKYVHPDDDFTMRVSGDVGCRSRRVWALGLMDSAPDVIDHATIAAAPWGRNEWGVALLMRDVTDELVPLGDGPVDVETHLRLLDAIAALAASRWGWTDEVDLLPHRLRWAWFGDAQLAGEERLGWPEAVPRIAADGWTAFKERVPADLAGPMWDLHVDPEPLSVALRATPQTFLHGDWKMGNVGMGTDGRVVLLDWAYPGEGPVAHELAWYLALNRSRLPLGHTKESTTEDLRVALERRGVDTSGWWTRQVELCFLGALVQFGWEKALGEQAELDWWFDAARRGLRWL
jgi:hypothetical protein